MVFAQIKDGIVKNIIVLDDLSLEDLFSEGFDFFIRIDEMEIQPGVHWIYDGIEFMPPVDDGNWW